MRKGLTFVVSLFFVSISARCQTTTVVPCATAVSQVEMHVCLSEQYRRLDKELATIYGSILRKLAKREDLRVLKALQKSQANWVLFRTSSGKVSEELNGGGSMMPVAALECTIETTRIRIKELQILAKELNR
ncbi:MAG: DUF1311 domain-containing protein [Hymenobacter sp.]|nr:MAG: DUF1311 domain-containing protein [Hymenobacter sp.]